MPLWGRETHRKQRFNYQLTCIWGANIWPYKSRSASLNGKESVTRIVISIVISAITIHGGYNKYFRQTRRQVLHEQTGDRGTGSPSHWNESSTNRRETIYVHAGDVITVFALPWLESPRACSQTRSSRSKPFLARIRGLGRPHFRWANKANKICQVGLERRRFLQVAAQWYNFGHDGNSFKAKLRKRAAHF